MPLKQIFLSSTSRDLAKHRAAVIEGIERLDGYHCVRMENFGARDWDADSFCRAKVEECDLFIGIVGHLHGSCPPNSAQSYTEREFEAAIAANKPRLMFIAPEDFSFPANLIESDEPRKKQREFRQRASTGRIRDTFTSPEDLAGRVVQAIHNWELLDQFKPSRRIHAPLHEISDIFLSYCNKDSAFMHRLHSDLCAAGLKVWIDERGLEPGTPIWEANIQNAIESARCLVVILSPDAKKSMWVTRELNYAEEHELRIIPVLARGDGRTAVPIRLISTQRIDARSNYAKAYHLLVFTLRKHLNIDDNV